MRKTKVLGLMAVLLATAGIGLTYAFSDGRIKGRSRAAVARRERTTVHQVGGPRRWTPERLAALQKTSLDARRGTVVRLREDVTIGDDERATQEEFARAFALSAPEPPQRVEHFSWLRTARGVEQIGWKVVIDHTETTPQGLLVFMDVYPELVSSSAVTMTPAHVVETYLYNGQDITLVSLRKGDAPHFVFGD